MTSQFHESQRRDQPRRISDRVLVDLNKTFSTCLELLGSAVLLLDNERRVIYATPQVDHIIHLKGMPFSLAPKFTLHDAVSAPRFEDFVNGNYTEKGLISLLLGNENNPDMLLTCFRLPVSSTPALHAARYMITLRDPNHFPAQQWQIFITQFTLTPAEARLCRALLDGLTLKDYCSKSRVTISTARSQLSSVFTKTATRRQSELLRLIYLFTRT